MNLEEKSKIVIMGSDKDYHLIKPTEEIIKRCVIQSNMPNFSYSEFWDKILECMKIDNSRLFVCDFKNYGRKRIEVINLKKASVIDYALEFFKRAENRIEKHNVNYILVKNLKAENFGSTYKPACFSGDTELII